MSVAELLKQYRELLARHDWFHAYSDDYSVYRRGEESMAHIRRLQPQVDHDFSMWNTYAPAEFRKPVEARAA